jgi:hypothetical protein
MGSIQFKPIETEGNLSVETEGNLPAAFDYRFMGQEPVSTETDLENESDGIEQSKLRKNIKISEADFFLEESPTKESPTKESPTKADTAPEILKDSHQDQKIELSDGGCEDSDDYSNDDFLE